MSEPFNAPVRSRWSYTTKTLWFTCIAYTCADLFYGYDSGMFGSLQVLPGFLNTFGQKIGGKQKLPTKQSSIMNSAVYAGKLAGALLFEPLCERIGFRYFMYLTCAVQLVATIIELAATNWVTFTIGRILTFMASGLVETAVPSYCSDVAPAPLRSMFAGSIVFVIITGQLWSNLMARAFRTDVTNRGWRIVASMQMVPVIFLVVSLPFTPESPRWLVSRGRKDAALQALNRLRPREDVDNGVTAIEVDMLEQAREESEVINRGSWLDIFRGTYLRRTCIASWCFIFQQINGTQFIQSFGATFYVQMGLGALSFDYTCITSGCIIVALAIALYFYDKVGRRPLMILGSSLEVPLMCVVAGVGGGKHPSKSAVHAVVACNILFTCFARMATDPPSYIIASEIGGVKLRRKIMTWAASWQVIAGFVVNYSSPYLLASPGANLGAKVGWIYAGTSVACLVFVVFFVPELNGRSLEEIDELFEKRLWAWQFSKAKTSGIGARIGALEGAATNHTFEAKAFEPYQEPVVDEKDATQQLEQA